jgi:hypothetical protein
MRENIALGLLLVLLYPFGASAWQDQPAGARVKPSLVLVAEPTKLVYRKGEVVEFNFTLHNISSENVIIARSLQLTLNLDLTIAGAHSRRAEWCGRIADQILVSKSRYTTLSGGASSRAKLVVSCVNEGDPRRAWGYRLDDVGKYTIRAAYRLPQPKEDFEKTFPNATVIQGPILAEPVTIELQ